jgi:hypothetical protein
MVSSRFRQGRNRRLLDVADDGRARETSYFGGESYFTEQNKYERTASWFPPDISRYTRSCSRQQFILYNEISVPRLID